MTLQDLANDVAGRLEEPEWIFWNETYEVLPELVDAMFEAALLTGVVQAVNVPITLPANTTYFSLAAGQGYGYGGFGTGGYGEGPYGGGVGVPGGVIAALRMRAPWTIRKVTLKGLSDVNPNWENQNGPGGGGYGQGGYGQGGYGGTFVPNQIICWFPLGVSGFGIFPQVDTETQVLMDFLIAPINAPRPYTPDLPVPFPEQFVSAFSEYAAALLRTKELSAESEEAAIVMEAYLDKMKQLSLYQSRLDSLVFTPSYGANAGVNRRELV